MSISYTENIDLATFLVATGRLEAEYLAGAAVPLLSAMGVYRQLRSQMTRAKGQAFESTTTPQERSI